MRYTLTLFLNLFFCTSYLFAQSTAEGCNNDRYISNIFSEVKNTTVKFGQNVNALGQQQELSMDIYEPVGDDLEKRPVVVLAFGGAFISGSKETMIPICIDFAKKGYVAATIDYRLWKDANPLAIPDSLDMTDAVIKAVGDFKAAVRYFRKDAATTNQFKIDPSFIFGGGISAGAITALHVAYLDADENIPDFMKTIIEDNGGLEGSSGDTENLNYSSSIQGVLNMSGGLYMTEWMDENDPPIASIHGTDDDVVPFGFGFAGLNLLGFKVNVLSINGSQVLHQKTIDIALPDVFISVEGGGHTDIYTNPIYATQLLDFNQKSKALSEKFYAVNQYLLIPPTI